MFLVTYLSPILYQKLVGGKQNKILQWELGFVYLNILQDDVCQALCCYAFSDSLTFGRGVFFPSDF